MDRKSDFGSVFQGYNYKMRIFKRSISNLLAVVGKNHSLIYGSNFMDGMFEKVERGYCGINIPPFNLRNDNVSKFNSNAIMSRIEKDLGKPISIMRNKSEEYENNTMGKLITMRDYLRLAFDCEDRVDCSPETLEECDWLNEDIYEKCKAEFMEKVKNPEDLSFEVDVGSGDFVIDDEIVNIVGRLDGIDANRIWEFKIVRYLTTEHKLQLILYAWLWSKMHKNGEPRKFYLFNIRTGEVLMLKPEAMGRVEEIAMRTLEVCMIDFTAKKRVRAEGDDSVSKKRVKI